ncbi:hypothetical protein GBA52_023132 [Prunus armeniaca]|nr:hypothetical protein GBA52_023132 [Prunus armeniaca]
MEWVYKTPFHAFTPHPLHAVCRGHSHMKRQRFNSRKTRLQPWLLQRGKGCWRMKKKYREETLLGDEDRDQEVQARCFQEKA